MKKYLMLTFLVVFLSTPVILFAQVAEEQKPKEPPTKLEAFLSKKGTLVIKDSYELGAISKLGRVTFDALVLYEPGKENQRIKGVRVEIAETGRLERKRVAFLDLEEVEATSRAIVYMIQLAESWKGQNRGPYTEVTFSTKGDFKVGFYQQGQKRSVYMNTGYVAPASSFMDIEDFITLKNILDKGLALLNQK